MRFQLQLRSLFDGVSRCEACLAACYRVFWVLANIVFVFVCFFVCLFLCFFIIVSLVAGLIVEVSFSLYGLAGPDASYGHCGGHASVTRAAHAHNDTHCDYTHNTHTHTHTHTVTHTHTHTDSNNWNHSLKSLSWISAMSGVELGGIGWDHHRHRYMIVTHHSLKQSRFFSSGNIAVLSVFRRTSFFVFFPLSFSFSRVF